MCSSRAASTSKREKVPLVLLLRVEARHPGHVSPRDQLQEIPWTACPALGRAVEQKSRRACRSSQSTPLILTTQVGCPFPHASCSISRTFAGWMDRVVWKEQAGTDSAFVGVLSLVCPEPLFPPRLRAELAECCKPARGSCSPHWLLPLRLQRCLSRLGMQVSVPGQVREEMRAAEIRWHQSSCFVPPRIARNATSPRSARQQAESLVLSFSLSPCSPSFRPPRVETPTSPGHRRSTNPTNPQTSTLETE